MALTRVSRHIIDEPLELQNINATGIGTFASLRVTGDLQVDGTTTTLDTVVTSVDRLEVGANNSTVGVAITQSGTGDIFNLYDGSNKEFSVTDGGTVKISQSMAFQQSDRATTAGLLGRGSLLIAGTQQTDFAIRSAPHDSNLILGVGVTERLRITSAGVVGINTDVSNNPSGSKLVVGGRIQSNAGGYWFAGANGAEDGWHVQDSGGNLLVVESGVAERLRITSDGKVRVPDGGKFVAGDGDDLQIYHDGHSKITNGAGHLYIDQDAEDGNIYVRSDDGSSGLTNYILCNGSTGAVRIHHYGAQKLETTSTGIQVTGQIDIGTTSIYGTGDISMGDSDKLRLGAGDDLRIYHNGSHSYIDETGDGNLYIRNGTKNSIFARTDGEVILYHNGNNKFETTSTGASVTGNLNLGDDNSLYFGAGDDLEIKHIGGSFNNIQGSPELRIQSASRIQLKEFGTTEVFANFIADGAVELFYDNSKKLETTTTGAKVTGALEVTQEYPTIRPTLDLNFSATKTLDRRITFTRDGVGTYVGEDGLVKYASNNTPRFDHDPITGESLGILIEESRTNDARNSSDFSSTRSASAYGNKTTVNTNVITAPDGTLTADQIVTVTTSTQNRLAQTHSVTNGSYYTYSVFIKYDNLDNVQFYLGYGGHLNTSASFTFSTETITGGDGTAAFVKYPNGWYRISFTGQAFSTGSAYSGFISGTTANLRVYVWGEQIEVGSFPTSYIPTGSSAVTRGADLPYIEGSNFSDFYDTAADGGTFFVEFGGSNTSGTILSLGPDSGHTQTTGFGNSGYTQGLVSSNYNTYNTYGGTGAADAGWNTTGTNKFAFTITSSQVKLCGNGKAVKTGSGTTPIFTNFTKLTFGGNISWDKTYTGQKKSHMRSIKYYRSLLSDSQLQGLTQQ